MFKLERKVIYTFVFFLIGYVFAIVSNNDKNLIILFENIRPIYFIISNIFYFIIMLLIIKILIKNREYFQINNDTIKSFFTGFIKLFLIGYFIGSLTLLGNVFVKIVF